MYEADEDQEERDAEYDRIDRLEAYADDLYDSIKNGDISEGQARGMYQRASSRPRRMGL